MSVFRDAVRDCLDYEPTPIVKPGKLNRHKTSIDPEVERFSGLRIRYIFLLFPWFTLRRKFKPMFNLFSFGFRNQLVTPAELNDWFSGIRFVRLSTIKYLHALHILLYLSY